MKTYIEKNFDLEALRKINLQEVGAYYDVPRENFEEEKLEELGYDLEDYMTSVIADEMTINEYGLWDNVEYSYTDEDERADFLHGLMNYKAYDHFLVVLFNSRWTGASGYKIFSNYIDCFVRDYDCTMYVVDSTPRGKCLLMRETHHDVPMGHSSIIIGLTNREYEKLQNMDFEKVINFAEKWFESL